MTTAVRPMWAQVVVSVDIGMSRIPTGKTNSPGYGNDNHEHFIYSSGEVSDDYWNSDRWSVTNSYGSKIYTNLD